ncbi:MAG TPA: cyclic dehypoxanthinyl futalosine synthase [Acidobacteriota bacterium]|nr:cyclic dehypoxanthinyl futalosine synthase [Acidobacteriota bacterium]HQM62413.1 cyclic dehypoxanthinyl futalosine synthase [Acidobacteriota bacterium]
MPADVFAAIERGERLERAAAIRLAEGASLHELGYLADCTRRRLLGDRPITYVVDRNINYTNVCSSKCRFCAFYRDPDAADAYVLEPAAVHRKIEETLAVGGTGILMQGGLHPGLDIRFFETLLRGIRERYAVDLHCFSPPEIVHIATVSGITLTECLSRLMAAGLGSLPGGGAEILDDTVRGRISPRKCSAAEWLLVMETAHGLGLCTTATMMFGCGENLASRMNHLESLRRLQDRTGGFVAFIPWTFQSARTDLGDEGGLEATAVEYLRFLALSRIYLDNFRSVQSSWVTQGLKIAQVALAFGANDIGSVMLEENVVAATGTVNRTNEAELRRLIRDAGFTPARRNNRHEIIEPPAGAAAAR